MDYIENNDTKLVGKFTRKFIINYIIGAILIGVVVSVISEILLVFLSNEIKLIFNFLLTILGFWKISSSAVETSLKEVTINENNLNKVLKNIFIFLGVLLVINILFAYLSYDFSMDRVSNLKDILTTKLVTNIFVIILQYGIMMLFCKNKLEGIILGKHINKTLYIVLSLIAIIILCSTIIFNNNDNNSTNVNNNIDSTMQDKYSNADWVEVGCSNSVNVDSNIATVDLSLGHFNKNTIERYKVIKVICTIYKASNNEVIGTSEKYYEDVELEYGYTSFSKIIRIKLSNPFVGNNFTSKVEVYGIPEE